ncbi:MAG TPA: glycosyltransferase family 25 protein [Rhodopila sp.]|nr:glycosyltransferase family 25 protein [Rhodopila sp.]
MHLPIFVINLERDAARRSHMQRVLGELGLAAEFVTAVDGRRLSAEDRAMVDRPRMLRIYGCEMMDTEIACYLSHYRLYQRMVRDGIDLALVLEDDVHIHPDLPMVLRDLLVCAFTDWSVVRLDSKRTEVHRPGPDRARGVLVAPLSCGYGLYRLRTRVLGTGAYLIRRTGAERMLSYGQRVFMPIDQTIDRYWENGILPYVVRPFPVQQREEFGSSTGPRALDWRRDQPASVRWQRRAQRSFDGICKRIFNLVH